MLDFFLIHVPWDSAPRCTGPHFMERDHAVPEVGNKQMIDRENISSSFIINCDPVSKREA